MSDHPLRVLVTGVGGDLGQALVKCLRLIDRPVQVFGCDAATDSVGAAFVDEFFVSPFADEKDYLASIQDISQKKDIQAIIPGCEADIFALSQAIAECGFSCGIPVVCHEYPWLKVYGDKLQCFRALDGKVKLASYADGSNQDEVTVFVRENEFPCIVKSRRSYGSKSLRIANDEKQLHNLLTETNVPLLQEYIDDSYGEFSIGVFVCDDFSSAVAFKRTLGPVGASWYADNLDQHEDILEYSMRIAETSNLRGSCNIQVRNSSKGVRLLEINPRFSSLVAARAACGFKDLEWSLYTALQIEFPKPDSNFKPLKFRRYFQEMLDFGEGYAGIDEWLPRQNPLTK